jgi:hypothetical protein
VSDARVQLRLQAIFLLALVCELWTHMPNQNPTIASAAYHARIIPVEVVSKTAGGNFRAMQDKRTYDLLSTTMLPDIPTDFAGRHAGLFGNFNLLDGIATPDGFYSMYLFEQRQIWSKLFYSNLKLFPAPLADFAGISYLTTNVFEWEARPSARPLLSVGAQPIFLDRGKILNRVAEPDFDPGRFVYLPLEARNNVTVTNASSAHILRSTRSSTKITAEVECAEPALLVLAQTYYKPWRASVNEKPVTIWRANHAFQALQIPAGHSQVNVIYEDKEFRWGSLIAALTLLGCIAGWLRPFSRFSNLLRSQTAL